MHDCVCTSPLAAEHAVPPLAAATDTRKVRDCVPPPHVALHAPKVVQLPTQFTAHPCVLHACVSVAPALAEHTAPPLAAAVDTTKVRVCVPTPHDALHPDHALHDATQLTGHPCVLHDCEIVVPLAVGQASPPLAAEVAMVYVMTCVPPPHVLLQAPQGPQKATQLTGQPCVLHACDCVAPWMLGHGVPPLAIGVVTV